MRHVRGQSEAGSGDYTAERQRRQDQEGPSTPEAVIALGEELLREQNAGRLGPVSPHTQFVRP